MITEEVDDTFNSQKTLHISLSQVSSGVSIVRNLEKIDHLITVSDCNFAPTSQAVSAIFVHIWPIFIRHLFPFQNNVTHFLFM